MQIDHFRRFAAYNGWANRHLYDACGQLPDQAYRQRRPSFFGSIHATLNHILVADRIWLARIEGGDAGIEGLDAILHDDLADLRRARENEDERIADLVHVFDDAGLDRDISYRTTSGVAHDTPLRDILAHLFNHQTHHRGQVHDMLSQTEVAPPPLDLIFFLREKSAA